MFCSRAAQRSNNMLRGAEVCSRHQVESARTMSRTVGMDQYSHHVNRNLCSCMVLSVWVCTLLLVGNGLCSTALICFTVFRLHILPAPAIKLTSSPSTAATYTLSHYPFVHVHDVAHCLFQFPFPLSFLAACYVRYCLRIFNAAPLFAGFTAIVTSTLATCMP